MSRDKMELKWIFVCFFTDLKKSSEHFIMNKRKLFGWGFKAITTGIVLFLCVYINGYLRVHEKALL